MNAIFLKIAIMFKTILAALGVGGCLPQGDVDILDNIVDDLIKIEQSFENTLRQ